MESARPVLLIDFSALFRRAWHVSSEMSIAYQATVAGVNRAASSMDNALVAICCDGKGNWRKELSKEYKAQREAQPAVMYGEMDRTLDRLRKDGRLVWKFDGFEADDVIASATMQARTRGHTVRIASHDKDLLQLLGPGVDYLAIHVTPWEIKTHLDVVDKYGVESTQFGDWLALKGDSSDNVKGCPGVGDKTATSLLQRFNDIDNLYAAIGNEVAHVLSEISPNVLKNLVAHKEDVYLSRILVSLSREVPLRFDEIYETREIAAIYERDQMSEAEQDAEKYFGSNDAPKREQASVKPEAIGINPAQPTNRTAEQSVVAPETVSAAPAPVERKEKTPDEVALVSQPTQTEVIPIVEYSRQLEPRSFREATIFANVMANARVYSRYPTRESMVAAIVRGREMGYGAGTSLDIFHVADFNRDGNLRLMMHAHLIIERVEKDPDVEYFYFDVGDETKATYKAKKKRNPKEQTFTYTIEDAKLAGLVKLTFNGQPNTWMKRPKEQLRKTCGVQFGRIIAPGAAIGLYCMEEMGVDYE